MVIKGNVDKSAFKDIFKEKNIQSADVDNFLENMVGDQEGIIHLFNWSKLIDGDGDMGDVFQVPNLETGKMEPLITGDDNGALTKDEEIQFRNMVNRLHKIFQYAKEQNVRVMIDAEQSYFQPAIHRLAIEMMRTYNTDRAIVFNTYQCYLKKAYKTIVLDLEQAKRQNFYFGAKLVRGAYMEQERARAELLGYKDPINPDYPATSAMYHKVLDECLTRTLRGLASWLQVTTRTRFVMELAVWQSLVLTPRSACCASPSCSACATKSPSLSGRAATVCTNTFPTGQSTKSSRICPEGQTRTAAY